MQRLNSCEAENIRKSCKFIPWAKEKAMRNQLETGEGETLLDVPLPAIAKRVGSWKEIQSTFLQMGILTSTKGLSFDPRKVPDETPQPRQWTPWAFL